MLSKRHFVRVARLVPLSAVKTNPKRSSTAPRCCDASTTCRTLQSLLSKALVINRCLDADMLEPPSSHLLVTAFPDGETINSFLRRHANLAGDSHLKTISQQLLARGLGLDGMPSRLDEFQTRIGYLFGDRNSLETLHTLLHYELLGVPPTHLDRLKARLRAPCLGPIRASRLPVLLAPSEGSGAFCPECAEDALDQYGFPFTHRRDIAPFVAACPVHFCWLQSAAGGRHMFDEQCSRTPSALNFRSAIQYALHSAACVEGDGASSGYERASVIDALRQACWLTDGDRLRLSELLQAFHAFYRSRFHDCRLDALVSTHSYVEAALRALMRDDRAVHAMWCILLKWFTRHCECSRPRAVTRKRRHVEAFSAEKVKTVLSLHGSTALAAHELKTSTHQLTIFCRCAGIPTDARPSKLNEQTLNGIRQRLASGMPPSEVALATGISTSTVYRVQAATLSVDAYRQQLVKRSTEEAKRKWVAHSNEHPRATITQLRQQAPATYAVLHRNAPEWLRSRRYLTAARFTRGPAPRSDVALFALAGAVNAACAHLDSQGGPPVRRSGYRLRELLGISEYAMKSSIDSRSLRMFSQTYDEHVAVRVRWALRVEPTSLVADWRLARVARLRQTTLKNWKARQ